MNKKNLKNGFTLLETIVALAVILAAVAGPVALVQRGFFSAPFAKNRLIAVNLAHEGIELVRLARENNVLCEEISGGGISWNRDPESGTSFGSPTGDNREVYADQYIAMGCPGYAIYSPRLLLWTGQKLRLDASTGLYGFSGTQETLFSRRITIYLPPEDPDADIPANDQMEIVSTVEWQERGAAKSVTLRERFYNWK